MAEPSAARKLRLGTVGWQRDSWLQDYFPDDLPEDWRLSYFANDCDCVLVQADAWRDGPGEELAAQLPETPPTFRCFLQLPAHLSPAGEGLLDLFDAQRTILLVEHIDADFDRLAQWQAAGPDRWRDPASGDELVRWSPAGTDLRAMRRLAEQLDAAARAVVLDGPSASPAGIPELRTLLELLGRA